VAVDVGEDLGEERGFEAGCVPGRSTHEQSAEVLVGFGHVVEAARGGLAGEVGGLAEDF